MKPKLGAIIVGVNSIDKAKLFYLEVFELTVKEQSQNYLACDFNGILFELEEDSSNRFTDWKQHNVGTYKNTQINVTDIATFCEKVKECGGKVLQPLTKKPWGNITTEISDPDGNMFLVSQDK